MEVVRRSITLRTVRGNGPSMNLRVEQKHVYWTLELSSSFTKLPHSGPK